MQRFKYCLWAAAGILILAGVLALIGPKRAMAALGFTPVRDVDGSGRQPFSVSVSVPRAQLTTVFNVPAHKRLIITYVDAFTVASSVDDIEVYSTVNGISTRLFVPFTATPFPNDHYASQQVMGFADEGTPVNVEYFGSAGSNAGVDINGYFVDVP